MRTFCYSTVGPRTQDQTGIQVPTLPNPAFPIGAKVAHEGHGHSAHLEVRLKARKSRLGRGALGAAESIRWQVGSTGLAGHHRHWGAEVGSEKTDL